MNKKVGIIVGILVLLLFAGGGFFFLSANKTKTPASESSLEKQMSIEKLSPESIDLALLPSSDGKKLKISASKVSDVKSLEFEITYEADTPASEMVEGAEARVQRGFTGEAELKGESKYESKEFDLGSCSKNVCRYDIGIEEIIIMMKVTKKDGKVYQVDQSVTL